MARCEQTHALPEKPELAADSVPCPSRAYNTTNSAGRRKSARAERNRIKSASADWNFVRAGHLFERKDETRILVDAFHRRLFPNSKPELLLISGGSGTGKTLLALQLQRRVKERGGWFVVGKFDQMKRVEPYAPLIAAVTRYIRCLLSSDPQTIETTRESILKAVGNDIGVLIGMIPSLKTLVGKYKASTLNGADVQRRFKIIFCKFMNAACLRARPLVIVLDDLQWADPGSLEILEGIVSEPGNHALVVVGICRSNEVSLNHDFAVILRRLEDENNTIITNVKLGCFTQKATAELVSIVLQQPQHLCTLVAAILHEKTSGNPLFLVQLLKSLHENAVLVLDEGKAEWLWDEDKWKHNYENVDEILDLIIQRVQSLPSGCRLFLSTCACLGAQVDMFLVSKLMDDRIDVQNILAECIEKGVVHKDEESSRYRFFHDRTQQACYYLINGDERALFHLSIGRLLFKGLLHNELDEYLFVVIDQMSRAIEEDLMDDEERIRLVSLCVRAGGKAAESHDFTCALKYLKLGSSLLDQRGDWRDNYDLALSLENGIAKVSYLAADYGAVYAAFESIDSHARCLDDKIPGYILQIYTMNTEWRLQEALDLGFQVLTRLKEPIPSKPSRLQLGLNLLGVKLMLRGKSDRELMGMPDMADKQKLAAMSILNLMVFATYTARKNLFPFVILKMVRLSLQFGVSAVSSVAFASYGMLLNALGDLDGSYRFSCLGMSLLEERFSSVKNDWIARVQTIHYGMNLLWKRPITSILDPLYQAYEGNLESGDREFTHHALHLYCKTVFLNGCALDSQEQRLRDAVVELRACNKKSLAQIVSLILEAILLLQGKDNDDVVTSGVLVHLESGSDKATEVITTAGLDFELFFVTSSFYMMISSYHLGDMDTAVRMVEHSLNQAKLSPTSFGNVAHAFYSALTCLTAVRQNPRLSKARRRKLLKYARKYLKYLEKRGKHCPANIEPKTLLLEAEFEALKGKMYVAITLYSKARELASKEGCLDVQALACERSSLTLHEGRGNERQKFFLLRESNDLYRRWGATVKVKQTEQLMADWQSLTQPTNRPPYSFYEEINRLR
jgi:histidine kinase